MAHMPPLSVTDAFAELRRRFPGPARVYVAGCSGEPQALADAIAASPDLAADVTFLGIWIPGVNKIDWASLSPNARSETIFLSPAYRQGFEAGRTAFRPLPYTQADPWLTATPVDIAVAMVSPPGTDGRVSLGVSADFTQTLLSRTGVAKLAIVNAAMPAPRSSPRYALETFDLVSAAETPLIQVPPVALPPAFAAIAANIAGLIEDGDTLQFGLGNVQQSVLEALRSHRDLVIHSGMVSDPVLGLIDAGALRDGSGAVTTGVAIGTDALYARMGADAAVRFAPVSYTHSIATLSGLERFKAINSVIEVDLFGQANAEFIGGRQVSGTGGLVDFLRGAALSPGGRAIAALSSTARGGSLSRIVPRLPADATSITRADLQTVVTEHGVADLRHKSLDARAEAIIAVADPAFRASLSQSWDEMRRAI